MKTASFLNKLLFQPRPRALLLLGSFLLLTTFVTPGPPPRLGAPGTAPLAAVRIVLDSERPEMRRVGGLLFRRGWSLSSPDRRFGGISAIHVERGRAMAISDDGYVLRFALPGAGPGTVAIAPLRDGPGDRDSKLDRDTEAMLVDGASVWVGYERHNMIWRHRRGDLKALGSAQPAAMRRWRRNSGAEAMARLADGRFLVLGEGGGGAFSPAVLFDGDPASPATAAAALRIRCPPGYRVTDAAALPDGRLLVLFRRFDWRTGFSARLALADTGALGAGATIEPRLLARLEPPLAVDNMEALSVAREGGRTIVRIASDDNFMRWQRTLLLEFELAQDEPARAPGD